jgi:hypothetical protein
VDAGAAAGGRRGRPQPPPPGEPRNKGAGRPRRRPGVKPQPGVPDRCSAVPLAARCRWRSAIVARPSGRGRRPISQVKMPRLKTPAQVAAVHLVRTVHGLVDEGLPGPPADTPGTAEVPPDHAGNRSTRDSGRRRCWSGAVGGCGRSATPVAVTVPPSLACQLRAAAEPFARDLTARKSSCCSFFSSTLAPTVSRCASMSRCRPRTSTCSTRSPLGRRPGCAREPVAQQPGCGRSASPSTRSPTSSTRGGTGTPGRTPGCASAPEPNWPRWRRRSPTCR